MASTSFHSKNSSKYDRMAGGCTSVVATEILTTLSALSPITAASYILDNACGTGIVTEQIKALHPDVKIMCADLTPGMLAEIPVKAEMHGWTNVETALLDIRDLSAIPDNTFTHAITNFGIASTADDPTSAQKALEELYRVLKPGGVCAVSIWAERSFPAAFEATARIIRPEETPKGMVLGEEWSRGSWLVRQLEDVGFGHRVIVKPVDSWTTGKSLDELTDNLMLAAPMFFPTYSEEEIGKAREVMRVEVQKLSTFELLGDETARIGMSAIAGLAWKL